jgi:hypothetical protein
VAQCSAFIAVIGPGWADVKAASGKRRLDEPNDYVRIEIEAALQRGIRVIPVLVDGAQMPAAEELPDSIKALARRHAVAVSHNRFGAEVAELARLLQRTLGVPNQSTPHMTFLQAIMSKPPPSFVAGGGRCSSVSGRHGSESFEFLWQRKAVR